MLIVFSWASGRLYDFCIGLGCTSVRIRDLHVIGPRIVGRSKGRRLLFEGGCFQISLQQIRFHATSVRVFFFPVSRRLRCLSSLKAIRFNQGTFLCARRVVRAILFSFQVSVVNVVFGQVNPFLVAMDGNTRAFRANFFCRFSRFFGVLLNFP